MEVLVENLTFLTWQQVLMWIIGGTLIYFAIVKEMEPSLLLPMGFGAILVNLPNSGAAGVIAQTGLQLPAELRPGIGELPQHFAGVLRNRHAARLCLYILTFPQRGITAHLLDHSVCCTGDHKCIYRVVQIPVFTDLGNAPALAHIGGNSAVDSRHMLLSPAGKIGKFQMVADIVQ